MEKVKVTETKTTNTSTKPSEEEAKKVALKFANYWEQKDYEKMYELFTPSLKKLKTNKEFAFIMKLFQNESSSVISSIRLNKIEKITDDVIYVYFDIQGPALMLFGGTGEIKLSVLELKFIGDKWYFDAFGNYFEMDLLDSCSQQKIKDKSECMVDLAKLTQDIKYCDYSKCKMKECYSLFNADWGRTEKIKVCDNCALSIFETCFTDLAIEYNDAVLCDKLLYLENRVPCYGNLAAYTKDISLCYDIAISDSKGGILNPKLDCIKLFGKNTGLAVECENAGYGGDICQSSSSYRMVFSDKIKTLQSTWT